MKIKDVVYQIPARLYYGGPLDTSGVPRVHTSPDPGQNEEIVIYYAVGRRGYDRCLSEYDARPNPVRLNVGGEILPTAAGSPRGNRFRMVDSSGSFLP